MKTQKTIAVHVMPPAMTEMTAVQIHRSFAGVSTIAIIIIIKRALARACSLEDRLWTTLLEWVFYTCT